MITLYGFGPLWGLVDLSPFVSKVDAYLRLARLTYRLERYPFLGIGNTPKGKLPFIEDAGEHISDSGFIVEHLKRKHGADLDARLDSNARAISLAVRRMVEEHLYWALVQLRWRDDAGWEKFMGDVFGAWRSDPQLAAILPQVRHGVLEQLRGQGMGRHTVDEVWQLAADDLAAMAELLGENAFLLGPEPTSVDASAYAFLAHLQAGLDSPCAACIRRYDNLVDYCARMDERLSAASVPAVVPTFVAQTARVSAP